MKKIKLLLLGIASILLIKPEGSIAQTLNRPGFLVYSQILETPLLESFDLETGVRSSWSAPAGNVEVYEDKICVSQYDSETKKITNINIYNLQGVNTKTIPIPVEIINCQNFVVLPNLNFALLDNLSDNIYFIDYNGSLLKTVDMIGAPSGRSQDLDGVVVGNSLIFSENGNTQLLKIDLDDYNVSVFRNLSGLPGSSISCIDYNDGRYYVCSADESGRYIYSFIEGQLEELVCTIPSGSSYITSIKVFDNYVYATLYYEFKILKINISTGGYTVFYEAPTGTFYPKDIEGINLSSYPAPTATSVAATDVAITNAALNGIVNANDISTNVTFEYWTENSEKSSSPATPSPVTGADNTAVSADITALDAGTTYYFRVKAESTQGSAYSDVLTFTTYNADATHDVDGNYYNIITIGDQTWMAENLRTTTYNTTSTSIPNLSVNEVWMAEDGTEGHNGAYCWYENTSANQNIYGALYNWYAVNSGQLCPTGWHVPIDEEWHQLILFLDPGAGSLPDESLTAGGMLKEAGTSHWPENAVTDESGFKALPGGGRYVDSEHAGVFEGIPWYGYWWCSTEDDNDPENNGVVRYMIYNDTKVVRLPSNKKSGFSVRCVKDAGILPPTAISAAATVIASTSATLNGTVNANNASTVVTFIYGLTPTTMVMSAIANPSPVGGTTDTPVSAHLTGLDPGQTYHFYIKAENSGGIVNSETLTFSTPGKAFDVNGNWYNTVKIGEQLWFQENLKVTQYRNGDAIPYADNWTGLGNSTDGAYANYDNNATNGDLYGRLYNAYTVVDNRNLCPTGWHVPTSNEWLDFANYLFTNGYNYDGTYGGDMTANKIAKAIASETGWILSYIEGAVGNTDYPAARNKSGFTGLSGGFIYNDGGTFRSLGEGAVWWTSSETDALHTVAFSIWSPYTNLVASLGGNDLKAYGFSVRCLQGEGLVLPAVTTIEVTGIGTTVATSGGNITSEGGSSVTSLGVCWSTSHNPTIANSITTDSSEGGSFTSSITGLAPGATYYVRAYATNSVGTAYGNEVSFTTNSLGVIQDFDGNYYNIVIIGTQYWLGENLKVSHLANGNPIPNVTDNTEWGNLTTPGLSWYNHDEAAFKDPYGALYNWFAVKQGNLCPVGWYVPTMADWDIMRDLLGGAATAGGPLKESGTLHWLEPNAGATNSTGFTGLPGGYRAPDGLFRDMGIEGMFWTSTDGGEDHAYTKHLFNHNTELFHGWDDYKDGISVRCINDQLMVTNTSDAGIGSLRNAMEYANLNPGEDIITFNIPGTGPFTIQPQETLPEITDPVIIDGYSQPGTSNAASKLLIELDGTNAGEGSDGLKINADNCTIKGLVINSFNGVGIYVDGNSEGNIIAGNYIGTDINGTEDLGNNGSGIYLDISARENRIGGVNFNERNIISGNDGGGIFINENIGNTVIGNYIGVDISGQQLLGNNSFGVQIAGGRENIIGGANSDERNLISSNEGDGISILHGASANTIKGNYIGVDVSGKLPLGNKASGVIIRSGLDNRIGGVNPGEGNVISFNSGAGISIDNGAYNNIIAKNSIYSNSKIGIDLMDEDDGDDGVTENDVGDGDSGPNGLQNFPVLESITYSRGVVDIIGSLNSAATTNYTIQFFASKLVDESGYGEGQIYLGSDSVETDDHGIASFSETFPRSSSAEVFTATATDPAGNTSEFSMAIGGLASQELSPGKFSYEVNGTGVPNVPALNVEGAVDASFLTWSNVKNASGVKTADILFADDGTTTEEHASNDGINLVTFTDNEYDIPWGVLAIAAKTWQVDQQTNTAQIMDADIVVNPFFVNHPTYNLGIEGEVTYDGYFDIQSVITHEIGHVLGLLHSGLINSTMWFQIGEGISVRDLTQDDNSWASYCYQTADYNSIFGSISGNITYGYDGQPVAGAFVSAINTTTNESVHAYSDADGNYIVPGLIPGSYNIFIEPLDGDVNGEELWPGNISEYIGSNTIYLDYPGEFYNYPDLGVEDNNTVTPVSVSAGPTLNRYDIITNQDKTPPTVELVKPTLTSGDLVNVLSNFNIRFSEPVDMETLTGATCYLSSEGTTETVTGNITKPYSEYPSTVLFDPSTDLNHDELYTLHITTGVKDLRDNNLQTEFTMSFNTIPLDETAPWINEVIPADDSINVFISSTVKLIFSEPMNMSSVEGGFALTWTEEGTTNTVDGSFSWKDYNKMVTFTPSGYLKEGTEYTISVSDAVADLSGNPMESSRSFTFTTVAVAPPEILYIGPSGEDITINTPVVVDFSEPINTSSVNSTTFKLLLGLDPSSSAEPIDGTYEFFNENSTVVFRPLSDLAVNQDYTIILTEGIEDVSHPSSDLEYSETTFKTADKVSEPSISYLDLTYGIAGNAVTIAGAGFDPNPALNTVRFNGTEAVITKAYLTSLEVVVPAEAHSGSVTVTVNNKISNSRNFDIYTEILDPAGYATANAPIGKKSTHGSDVTPEGAFAYVTNPEEGTVSVVDMNTLDVETIMIGEGKYPLMIDINPEGTKAYVTNFYSSDVSVIDLVPGVNYNTVIKNISVGIGPWGVAVTPDGQRVYVANYYSGSLSMIDADPTSGGYDHATANIPIGKNPTGTKANPDGALVLVVGDFGLTIVNSDPSNKDEYNTATVNITIGKKFTGATSSPDGAFAIASTDDGYLLLIDLYPENGDYSDAVLANVKTGSNPSDIKARGDNAYVYLTDTDGDRILVYKIGAGGTGGAGSSMPSGIGMTLVYETEIPVGDTPQSLAIDADRLYVVDGDLSEPEVRRVTVIQFGLLSLFNGFSDLTKAIQGMIDAGDIKPANGKNIIRKLQDAQKYLDAGRTKNALNSLNAAGNMIKALMNSHQITADQGNYLLNMLNLIIAEIDKNKKSGEIDYYNVDLEQPVSDIITETKLGVIYPNPTKEAITINYEIAENEQGSEKVTIRIYDVIGRLVSNLVNKNMAPGRYTATWNGSFDNGEMASRGFYFIRFSAGKTNEVKQIILDR